ncbi:MAG: hypothetical protein ACRDQY_21860 [Pseudonocardiaceae bacterium]
MDGAEVDVVRRWVRFEMPVMVCVEVDEHVEDERVVTVVVGAEDEDITLARDVARVVLVYDGSMERVAPTEPVAAAAISVADGRDWPPRSDWEFGPDVFRDPWLYEEDPADEDDRMVAGDEHAAGADVRGW